MSYFMNSYIQDYNDNDLFYDVSLAYSQAKKQRIKGYYVCPECGEFIKAIAKKEVPCPFCGKKCQKVLALPPVLEQSVILRWKHTNCYHPLKADCVCIEH